MGDDPRATGAGDPAPILIQTTLRLEPWLLKAIAEQSKREGKSLEGAIQELLAPCFRRGIEG